MHYAAVEVNEIETVIDSFIIESIINKKIQ